ncbi:polyprenyl synthetase family protein [Spirochaeta dissipatitropha]
MHNFWSEDPSVMEDLRHSHEAMREMLLGRGSVLGSTAQSILDNQGKLLRPALLLLAARFGAPSVQPVRGKRQTLKDAVRRKWNTLWFRRCHADRRVRVQEGLLPDRMYRLAAAVELLHIATLIHDDIVDEAETRRGEPAMHKQIGPRKAVLLGDLLFASSFQTLVEDGSYATMSGAVGAVRNLSRGAISEVEDHIIPSRRQYNRRILGKTAVLFMAAMHVGAEEAAVPGDCREALLRVAYNLGMGFQIIDDILDLIGNPETLGKPADNDLREGIYTLPLVCTMQKGGPAAAELQTILRVAAKGTSAGPATSSADPAELTDGQRDRIREIVHESGGLEAAREIAGQYTRRALREISRLPAIPARESLQRVLLRLLERKY